MINRRQSSDRATRRVLAATLFILLAASPPAALSQTPGPGAGSGDSNADSMPGKRTFASSCAGCHGLDGRGGERAPNIAASPKLRRLPNTEIAAIVTNGIPGTGMPAFHALGEAKVNAVVDYLRALQGEDKPRQAVGDARRGQAIFFGKADCSSCHMMQGQGGFLGPDLSSYGRNRPAKEILKAILDPANTVDWKRKAATLVTRDGRTVTGLIRNEDNFSIQLQTADSAFLFFSKSELQSFEYRDQPVMPANYGERLSRSELQDLVNYLLSAAGNQRPGSATDE